MVENQVGEEDKDGQKLNIDQDASTNSSSDSIDLNKDELDYIPSQLKAVDYFRSKHLEQLDD